MHNASTTGNSKAGLNTSVLSASAKVALIGGYIWITSQDQASVFVSVSDLIMKITAHLLSQPKIDAPRRSVSPPYDSHSVVKIDGSDGGNSAYDIVVILDPASDKAQEILPIIKVSISFK